MNKTLLLIFSLVSILSCNPGLSQNIASAQSGDTIVFKTVNSSSLSLEVYYPSQMDKTKLHPAMVFFFGGGWNGGSRAQFEPQAKYFAQRGVVCFLADYRTKSSHGTPPFESVKDAKSAMRFIRAHAAEFGIDPNQIIASGGSAGGHLAAATAVLSGYNDLADDLSISCIPNALVLFNPVIDNGPGGYGYERVSESFGTFSPLHNIRKGAPPTLFMVGTEDPLIPVETAEYYRTVMEKVGSRCDLELYQGQKHGFFNYRSFENYKQTIVHTNEFIISLGLLENVPVVEIK